MKKLTCLFTLILLAGITFTGKTQDAPDTDISDFKLSMRIMIDETDPLALRVKGYLITAFREVPDIAIVKSSEDVVLQVSVQEATVALVTNGMQEETFQAYIGAATPHLCIPPEFIEAIDFKIGSEHSPAQGLLTFGNSVTPVWVGQTSIPFFVMPGTEEELERKCAEVVSVVNTLLHNEWEISRSMSEVRKWLKEYLKTK